MDKIALLPLAQCSPEPRTVLTAPEIVPIDGTPARTLANGGHDGLDEVAAGLPAVVDAAWGHFQLDIIDVSHTRDLRGDVSVGSVTGRKSAGVLEMR